MSRIPRKEGKPNTTTISVSLKLKLNFNLLKFSVMALYPQTTCFYKAVVNRIPSLATEEYEVLFEDASYPEGFSPPLMVAQRYLIQIKDPRKK